MSNSCLTPARGSTGRGSDLLLLCLLLLLPSSSFSCLFSCMGTPAELGDNCATTVFCFSARPCRCAYAMVAGPCGRAYSQPLQNLATTALRPCSVFRADSAEVPMPCAAACARMDAMGAPTHFQQQKPPMRSDPSKGNQGMKSRAGALPILGWPDKKLA